MHSCTYSSPLPNLPPSNHILPLYLPIPWHIHKQLVIYIVFESLISFSFCLPISLPTNFFSWTSWIHGCLSTELTQQRFYILRQSHECDNWGTAFSHLWLLIQHKKIHTVEKSYEYDRYAKTFRQPFTTHQSIHALQQLFECHNCGNTSTRALRFMQHQKKHMESKRYKCDACYKAFNFYSLLIQHQSSHWRETLSVWYVWKGL